MKEMHDFFFLGIHENYTIVKLCVKIFKLTETSEPIARHRTQPTRED